MSSGQLKQLSPHLQRIVHEAESLKSMQSLEDKSPPQLKANDGTLVATFTYRTISYYFTCRVFVKRQPHRDELGQDIYGNPVTNPYIADRLRNEAAVLQFIVKHTTIPVPKFLGLWVDNGLVHLKTALVKTGVELQHIEEPRRPAAVREVTRQLESEILPQLRRLHRNFMGSPNPLLPVIPPNRFWDLKESRVWPSTVKDVDDYVFCHTDLDSQNILVDPNTFRIVAIIDWETAGFFPQEWELHYWKANTRQERNQISEEAKVRETALFN